MALITAVKCDPTYATWTDAPGANESQSDLAGNMLEWALDW